MYKGELSWQIMDVWIEYQQEQQKHFGLWINHQKFMKNCSEQRKQIRKLYFEALNQLVHENLPVLGYHPFEELPHLQIVSKPAPPSKTDATAAAQRKATQATYVNCCPGCIGGIANNSTF